MENPYQDQSNIEPPQNDFRREIPTPVFNALAAARLSGAEYQVIFVVIDRSWGWSKNSANISLKHFERGTNLSRRSVITAIKSLELKRIIVLDRYTVERDKKAQTNEYLFNKYYDTWEIQSSEVNDTTPPIQGSEVNDTTLRGSEPNDTTPPMQGGEVNDTTPAPENLGSEVNDTTGSEPNDTTSSEANDTTSSEVATAGCGYAKESTKETIKESTKEKYTPQKVVDLYHELCPSLPKIRELSEKRKKAIKTILQKKDDDPISFFTELFTKAESSDFLSGRQSSEGEHQNWRCSFDWLLEERNRLKVLEGNYDNKGGPHGRGASGTGEGWAGFRVITDD